MKKTLLLTSAGRRGQLIECFRKDAADLGIELKVVAADLDPSMSPACHLADRAVSIPSCVEKNFVEAVDSLCEEERVDLWVPLHDAELLRVSSQRESFAKKGVRVVASSEEAVAIAQDKGRSMQVLGDKGVSVPRTVPSEAFDPKDPNWHWPLIAKPNQGRASEGVRILENPEAAAHYLEGKKGMIVQDFCQGDEYTVNVFVDHSGNFQAAVPHLRAVVHGGEVAKGKTVRVPILEEAAKKIIAAIPGLRGPFCFQAILGQKDQYWVFEINPRFGGGYPLAHRAGAPFSKWLLEALIDEKSSASNDWREGVTMLRYDQAVFIDP